VPGDQKLADSVHINSEMRHVCLQLLAADWQARPLSNLCSVHSQQQQTLGSCCADWRTLRSCWSTFQEEVSRQWAGKEMVLPALRQVLWYFFTVLMPLHVNSHFINIAISCRCRIFLIQFVIWSSWSQCDL